MMCENGSRSSVSASAKAVSGDKRLFALAGGALGGLYGTAKLQRLRAIAASTAALLSFSAYLVPAEAQVPLPDTQAEIDLAIRAKWLAGGGLVILAPGIIDVAELRVMSKVGLVGSGVLGAPKTTLRLRAKSDTWAIKLGGGVVGASVGNVLENVIIDGNRVNQNPLTYRNIGTVAVPKLVPNPRPAVLSMACSNCAARYVRVVNAMFDGLQVSVGRNVTITNSSASVAGRFGMLVSDSSDGVKIHSSSAVNTGVAWTYPGGGAGFAAGGKNVEFRFVSTRSTNGDGVAAYGSANQKMSVLDSTFYAPKNHCVHLGGDGAVIARNKCYDPALVGFYLASDWRPDAVAEREAVGGRILNNYVEDSGSDGIKVQWHVGDTLVQGNSVVRSRYNNFGIFDSRGVTVTANVGRWPSYNFPAGKGCHLHMSTSRVVQSLNNFSYTGRTKPLTC